MLLGARRWALGLAVRHAPHWLRYLYPTPKLDVRAAVFRGDELLLVRDAGDGRWSLPGGWVDLGESLASAARREVAEESGLAVEPRKVLAVLNVSRRRDGRRLRVNVLRLLVGCELAGEPQQAIRGVETSEARFFAQGALPELSTGRGTPEQLRLVFEHRRDPARPCDFD